MARVWLVDAGETPTPRAVQANYELPIDDCIHKLGLQKKDWKAEVGTKLTVGTAPRPGIVRGPEHVVVEIDKGEADMNGWRSGLYISRLSPRDVIERLGSPTL